MGGSNFSSNLIRGTVPKTKAFLIRVAARLDWSFSYNAGYGWEWQKPSPLSLVEQVYRGKSKFTYIHTYGTHEHAFVQEYGSQLVRELR